MEKRVIGGAILLIGAISGIASAVIGMMNADSANDIDPTGIIEGAVMVCAVIMLVFALIALLGAIMAITGKSWGLALVGGIFGLLCIGFAGTGSLFGLIGLIFIAISKDEFAGEAPQQQMGMYPPPGYPPQQPPPGYPPQQPSPGYPPQQQPPMAPPPEQPPMAPPEAAPAEAPPAEPPKEPEY